jgi:zinc-binding alcohol dehydrogenase family protein
MKAIVQTEYGEPEVMHFDTVPLPSLRPRDLRVRVRAIGVNPVDTKRRRGYGGVLDAPQIVGWDAAGVVETLGEKASRFKVGDEVYCAGDSTRQGCYAEFVAVDERIVGHKPKSLSFEEAAAIPLTALTACESFFEQMGLEEGPTPSGRTPARTAGGKMLIVGGAGGVGSIATQIAKRVCGLHVVATASRSTSAEFCRNMGADAVIDHSRDLLEQFRELNLAGADYILNCAVLSNFPQLVPVLNPLGTICCILGGPAAKSLDLSELVSKRGTLTFELMFTRPRLNLEPEKQGAILDRAAGWLDSRVLFTTLTKVMDWSEVQEAHRWIEGGHTVGKIVLNVTA